MSAVPFSDIKARPGELIRTDIDELDDVYGGGIPWRRVHLWAAEPGAGKSTLATQVAINLSDDFGVLYVSGEQGADEFKERAERVGGKVGSLFVTDECDMTGIEAAAIEHGCALVIIDSIQRVTDSRYRSAPGSVVQVSKCAERLKDFSMATGCTVIIVAQQTRAGHVMGGRALEHACDSTMGIRKDKANPDHRVMSCIKNRGGAADVERTLAMTATGFRPITPRKGPEAVLEAPAPRSRPLRRVLMGCWGLFLLGMATVTGLVALAWLGLALVVIAALWSRRLNRALLGGFGLVVGYRAMRWVIRG